MDIDAMLAAVDEFLESDRAGRKLRDTMKAERSVFRAVRRHWFDQEGAVISGLRRYRGRFSESRFVEAMGSHEVDSLLSDVFREPHNDLVVALDRNYPSTLRSGAMSALADAGMAMSFDLADTRAVQWLADRGAARVTMIDTTTRDTIRKILVEAAEDGWSYERTAKAITDKFSHFRAGQPQQHIRSRAELVAVTEIGEAYEAGRLVARDIIAATGVRVQKSWITVGGERVCQTCQGNAEDGWIDSTEGFASGHDAPLGHPACRCDMSIRAVDHTGREF